MHRYRSEESQGTTNDSTLHSMHEIATFDQQASVEEEPSIFVQFNHLLHSEHVKSNSQNLFSTQFLKKYILYAKNRINPIISPDAAAFISKAYADLRSKEDMKTLPVTPRTLDAMLRLTVAHAKCRLSNVATENDAKVALEIMSYALYHEAQPQKPTEQTPSNPITGTPEERPPPIVEMETNPDDAPLKRIPKRKRTDEDYPENSPEPQAKRSKGLGSQLKETSPPPPSTKEETTTTAVSKTPKEQRVNEFRKLIVQYMTSRHLSKCDIKTLCKHVNSQKPTTGTFSLSEAEGIVKQMEKDGSVLFRDSSVFFLA